MRPERRSHAPAGMVVAGDEHVLNDRKVSAMTTAISPALACMALITSGESGKPPAFHLSRSDISAIGAAHPGRHVDDVIREIANTGDDKDRRIAMLEGGMLYAEGALGAWLADNTEEAFEEQPEIDGIRSTLQEVLNPSPTRTA